MEQALLISKVSELSYWNDSYLRIYFGHEFCQELIPTEKALEKAIDFISKNKIELTLVTSFVNDAGLKQLQILFEVLSKLRPNSEIVVNDWGVFRMALSYKLKIIIGRLLTKQRRDPRIVKLMKKLPENAAERLKSLSLGPYLENFLLSHGVERLEVDNLLQGLIMPKHSNFVFSLYFPYCYVTVTRLCPFYSHVFLCKVNEKPSCARSCQNRYFLLKHLSMPQSLYLKGNAIFLKNMRLPSNLNEKNIDRIIHQVHIAPPEL
jgi:hypothetical protein